MTELTPSKTLDIIHEMLSPNARPHRDHQANWTVDTLDIGLVCLNITVFTHKHRRKQPDDVSVSLLGVREDLDGSDAILKHWSGHGEAGLRVCLSKAKKTLLGLAAGFLIVCGDEGIPGVTPSLGAPVKEQPGDELVGDNIDDFVDQLFGDDSR